MSENDFHARGAKDRLSGKTFRYCCELVSNQRNALRELNKAYFILKSKYNLLKMDLDDANKRLEESLEAQSRIDTAQTAVMYDVDGGLLSHDRDSIHNKEVDVALVVLK